MRYLMLSLMLFLVTACVKSGSDMDGDPERALRDWVARGEIAAEGKERGDLLRMISANYMDARGNDHERIGNILRVYFLRQRSISLLTSIDDISLSGDTAARVNLTVGMAGANDKVLGFSADAYQFELELEKPGDDWLLIGARWGGLGGELR
jgi:hypothetical protein